MKTKLVDVLLATPAGNEIRRILRLQSEVTHAELLFLRLRRVAENKSFCDARVCIVKFEGAEFAEDAVEVVFRCLEVSAVDWNSSDYEGKDVPRLEPSEGEIEI